MTINSDLPYPAALPDWMGDATNLEWRAPGIWFARSEVPVSYPAHGNQASLELEDRSFWFRHRNRCIVSLVKHFSPVGTFLDVGGGNGFVAQGLVDAGLPCALLEPGIDGALAAHARGIETIICARIEDAELPPACIAAAGMFDVLEHIEDDGEALARVYALLQPGGRLFIAVPAYQALFSEDDERAGHYRRYTSASLSRALQKARFRIEFSSYMFAPLPPLVFLFRTLPYLVGVRRGWRGAQSDEADHVARGLTARVMDWLLALESRRLDQGRSIPFGGSCICVAIKD